MNDTTISHWIDRAKINESLPKPVNGVKVIKNAAKSKGQIIFDIAEAMRPHLMKMFEGARDQDGLIAQPAHIRAFSLNLAQRMVNAKEQDNKATA